MGKYIKLFQHHQDYDTFTGTTDFVVPNVSVCRDMDDEVHYNPWVVDSRLIVKFNVTDTSNPTPIGTSGFSAIEIDGVEQPSVVSAYTFSTTGEHTVKYTLTDPTSIGGSAFSGCTSLTSITIPNSVTSIGNGAFYKCSSLTSINMPNSVTSISDSAFYRCSSLTSVTIGSGVTSISYGAFYGCSSLTSITIPNNVTSIGSYAFSHCSSLTSVTIPDSVTSIGEQAFRRCSAMTTCTIGSGVTSIGSYAFESCSGLTSCTIGSGVTSIGDWAFESCSSITSITCNATTAPTIKGGTFYKVKTGGKLYVPIGSSGYNTWMGTGNYYLGKYNWTKVEQ